MKPDPDRIHTAQRAGLRRRLIDEARMSEASADAWLAAFEREQPNEQGWANAYGWVMEQLAMGRKP